MTKKDYVAIAGAISGELKGGGGPSTLMNVARALCVVFTQDNPKFSGSVFMEASGFGGAGVGKGAGGGLRRGSGLNARTTPSSPLRTH